MHWLSFLKNHLEIFRSKIALLKNLSENMRVISNQVVLPKWDLIEEYSLEPPISATRAPLPRQKALACSNDIWLVEVRYKLLLVRRFHEDPHPEKDKWNWKGLKALCSRKFQNVKLTSTIQYLFATQFCVKIILE